MIDYVVLNWFIGVCLVLCGCAIGGLLCSLHYHKLLNNVKEEHSKLQIIDKDTISLLQDEARYWHTQVVKQSLQKLIGGGNEVPKP